MAKLDIVSFDFACGEHPFHFKLHADPVARFGAERDTLDIFAHGRISELEVCQVMTRAVRAGDRVVDGGANIGYFSLLLADLIGPTGKVYAFEPDPRNVSKIKANARLNGITTIEVIDKPLWAATTVKRFFACEHNGWGSLFDVPQFLGAKTRPIDGVSTTTLNEIAPPIRLMKLDLEGAELPALCGASRHITGPLRCPFIICEINEFMLARLQADQYMIVNFMRGHGYDTFVLHDQAAPQLVPPGGTILTEGSMFNVLFSTVAAVQELG